MKRLVITVICMITLSYPALAADWYWINSNDTSTVYIDRDSIHKTTNTVELWVKVTESNYSNKYILIRYKFMHSGYYEVLQAIEYDNNGQLIASHDYQYSPFETQMAIPPESIAEKIYHLIWG